MWNHFQLIATKRGILYFSWSIVSKIRPRFWFWRLGTYKDRKKSKFLRFSSTVFYWQNCAFIRSPPFSSSLLIDDFAKVGRPRFEPGTYLVAVTDTITHFHQWSYNFNVPHPFIQEVAGTTVLCHSVLQRSCFCSEKGKKLVVKRRHSKTSLYKRKKLVEEPEY